MVLINDSYEYETIHLYQRCRSQWINTFPSSIISAHPHVAWLSRLSEQFPNKPFVNRALMNGLDIPVLGKILQKKVKPRECYSYWNRFYPGFGVSCRDLPADDVTNRVKKSCPKRSLKR